MNQDATTALVKEIMLDYARLTGLSPASPHPKRYLWTDAFAVCTYLVLFKTTNNKTWRDLALSLVDQVHHVLGRHRDDDPRTGWISGLSGQEAEQHPTRGGLRIGKQIHERGPHEYYNERLEWDRDGQYYHYLTKWMHALNRVSRVTGDPAYTGWAIELAHTAHSRFTYLPPKGTKKRMYWKMSIDLARPLVAAMGQLDPLDGLITYNELQIVAEKDLGLSLRPDLGAGIAEMTEICRGMSFITGDPLGIGGLLSDALRIAQLMIRGCSDCAGLLDMVVDSALPGLSSFAESGTLESPAEDRLAFRELGLSIGLEGIKWLPGWIRRNPKVFGRDSALQHQVERLLKYAPVGEKIAGFWTEDQNQKSVTWTGHREINMVMLATSLAPEGFLAV